jgi:hypothetical protein
MEAVSEKSKRNDIDYAVRPRMAWHSLRRKSSRDFDRPSPDRPYAQKAIGLTVLVPKSIFVFL